MIYHYTRKELAALGAYEFRHGDTILVSKYRISIQYFEGEDIRWVSPEWVSFVEDVYTGKLLDRTPGAGTPYYIDDFLNR